MLLARSVRSEGLAVRFRLGANRCSGLDDYGFSRRFGCVSDRFDVSGSSIWPDACGPIRKETIMKIVTSLSFQGQCREAFEFYAKVLA